MFLCLNQFRIVGLNMIKSFHIWDMNDLDGNANGKCLFMSVKDSLHEVGAGEYHHRNTLGFGTTKHPDA